MATAAVAKRVLVYGGNGSLGSVIVNFFKTKNVVRTPGNFIRFMAKINYNFGHLILAISINIRNKE